MVDCVSVNFQTSKEGWTPLMAMCTRAEVKAAQVEKALKLGADVLLKVRACRPAWAPSSCQRQSWLTD